MKILNYFKDFSLYESSILEERMEKEKILKETEDIEKEIEEIKKENKIAIEKVKKEMDEDTINIVKKLLKTNLDIKTISDCTGLSIEEVKSLQEK